MSPHDGGGAAPFDRITEGKIDVSSSTAFPYTATELDQFRQVQRLAYDIAQTVESQLLVGMTEVEACTLIESAQARHDVVQVFHHPFAWFGTRTLLGADWAPDAAVRRSRTSGADLGVSAFFPTETTLAEGMSLILDLAPVIRGVSSDIGYACRVGANSRFDDLDRGLARIRTFLLEGVRAGKTLADLARELDALLAQRGWQNCHQHYPDRALGHLVFPLEGEPDRPSPLPGFGTAAAEGLLAAGHAARDARTGSPVWNDSPFANFPAAPGVWAVEPHIGRDGVGVKFEELLVVTEDDAFWLDDALPHAQRWAAAGYSIEPLGRV